jgi:midasin (ATPase involved in ribosome maturation)
LLRGNAESALLLQQSESAGSSAITPIVLSADYMVNSIFSGRHLSTRDLLKWCRRVNRHFQSLAQQGLANITVTYQLKELIYLEAIDCFCAMVPSQSSLPLSLLHGVTSSVSVLQVPSLANREKCYTLIGHSLGVPADRIQHFVQLYKPSLNLTPTSFSVGRATLPKAPAQELMVAPRKSKFAHTKHSLTLLERLAHCLSMGEPALLVGETGTGKTSVVQYLADQLDQKLVVQNLSQQTDSSDLLGGFKPVEMRILCIPLKAKFDQLFPRTFSKKVTTPSICCCVRRLRPRY